MNSLDQKIVSPTSVEEPEWLPGETEIESYEREGHLVTPAQVLPASLIERALYGVQRYYEGERDWRLPLSGGFLDWRPEHGGDLRINDYVSLQNEELYELCTFAPLAAIAGRLARVSGIRLFHDQLITKLPSPAAATAIGWHVDQAYWRTCSSRRLLTAWIPLVDISPEMGGLSVIPGSHRLDGLGWMTTFNDQDLETLAAQAQDQGACAAPVAPHVPLGSVSFHHGGLIHGSRPNRGDRPRIALTVHFQDLDNRYELHRDGDGRPILHVNDLLCRAGKDGLPDYGDPDICPILWQREPGS
jgi:hypothetical protein